MLAGGGCAGQRTLEASKAGDPPLLLGWIQRDTLMAANSGTYQRVYDTVQVQKPFVELLRVVSDDVDITVVLGTWCGDSRRGVPAFLKVADETGIPPGRVRLYGVDRTKRGPGHEPEDLAVDRVPTVVVRKSGVEVGRIVETPKVSWEADLLTILAAAQPR
jgi:thiol-disulfide isomerase/thioredoxin